MKTTIVRKSDWTSALSLRRGFLLILLLVFCVGHTRVLKAVSPTPDGSYPGANTAEGGSGALFSLTTGSNNTAVGSQTLYNVKTGSQNTALGAQALMSNNAWKNTATGFQALNKNYNGGENTATGWRALFQNTTGDFNTADGSSALYRNAVGSRNTASGWQALYNNSTGSDNTACGYGALIGGGDGSTAVGSGALGTNVSSSGNTAIGFLALNSNTSGESNTATGVGALINNTTGSNNTAYGMYALSGNYNFGTGSGNTAVGAGTLAGGAEGEFQNNTVVGAQALPLPKGGQNNIAIGYQAGSNLPFGDNNIEIGNAGQPAGENGPTIRIGDVQIRAFIAGIYGTTTGSSTTLPVIVDLNGQLGTAASSERFKKEIKPMDSASEAIMGLRPVTFHYKSDTNNTPQFGLIAEEVAEVNPDLVVRDDKGEIYTVRYDAVNAMLLNEFLKEHRKVEKLQATLTQLMEHLKEQDSKIEKISNELEMTRPGSHVVANR